MPAAASRAALATSASTAASLRWSDADSAAMTGAPARLIFTWNALYPPARVRMSLACGATENRPRPDSEATRCAPAAQQHTAPAAYEAHSAAVASPLRGVSPGRTSPVVTSTSAELAALLSLSIQTCASTRRTPSTNSIASGSGPAGSGLIARQRSTGTSTPASILAVDSSSCPSISRLAP